MRKRILNLANAQILSRNEQKEITGRGDDEFITCPCPNGSSIIVAAAITCAVAEPLYCPTDM
jgi:hypothetical protein